MKQTYRVAIVGCGGMGVEQLFDQTIPFTYSFAGAVFNNPQAQLAALVDVDAEKLQVLSARLKQDGFVQELRTYTSLRQVLESGDSGGSFPFDIICCAGGPQVNAEVIQLAVQHGVRGVYCEKPLALSLAAADTLVETERGSNLKVAVNYLRNFDTCHLAVLSYIREGMIGDLLAVRVLYKGGVLAVAPHALALLNHLFGQPVGVSGYYSPLINTRCPDDPNVDGVVQYLWGEQGRTVNVSLTATGRGDLKNDTYLFEFEFIGTTARISILENGWRIRYEQMGASRVFGASEQMPYDTVRIPLALRADAPREFMIEGLGRLINAIEADQSTTCNLVMARDAEEIAHALAISAEQGTVITLPLNDRTHVFANSRAGVKLLRQEAGQTSYVR